MLTGAQLYNAKKGMQDLYNRLQKVKSGQPVREPRTDREKYIKGWFNFIEKVVERRGVSLLVVHAYAFKKIREICSTDRVITGWI